MINQTSAATVTKSLDVAAVSKPIVSFSAPVHWYFKVVIIVTKKRFISVIVGQVPFRFWPGLKAINADKNVCY